LNILNLGNAFLEKKEQSSKLIIKEWIEEIKNYIHKDDFADFIFNYVEEL